MCKARQDKDANQSVSASWWHTSASVMTGACVHVHILRDTLAFTSTQIHYASQRFLKSRSPNPSRSEQGKTKGKGNIKAGAEGTKASPSQLGDIFLAI